MKKLFLMLMSACKNSACNTGIGRGAKASLLYFYSTILILVPSICIPSMLGFLPGHFIVAAL